MSFEEIYRSIMEANFPDSAFSDKEIINRFELLYRELVAYNEKVNLTAVTDMEGVVAKHFADSLLIEKFIPRGATVCDVGCGGGFPTLPLACVRPDIKITALDSTAKKLKFVEYAARKIGLNNVEILSERAEIIARDNRYRESFDCVCARAVARLNVLCELCLPLAKTNGIFISCKANSARQELDEAQNALKLLKTTLLCDEEKFLFAQNEKLSRRIFVFKKKNPCPQSFPRPYSQISKKPL